MLQMLMDEYVSTHPNGTTTVPYYEIVTTAVSMLVSGHFNTFIAAARALTMLLLHPEEMQHVRAELEQVFCILAPLSLSLSLSVCIYDVCIVLYCIVLYCIVWALLLRYISKNNLIHVCMVCMLYVYF